MKREIPQSVFETISKLEANGFEAFVVGGCVRDLLLSRVPNDWDVTTNAKPKQVLEIFPDGKYENKFGTVLVPEKYLGEDEDNKGIVEITTYRIESKYSDKRHPDEVKFAKTLQEDLSRRDLTVNAMALQVKSEKLKVKSSSENSKVKLGKEDFEIVDLFEGQKDLADKKIRAVGDAQERFDEDALRMMRAVRFAVQLRFSIEEKTLKAIKSSSKNLSHVSNERIRDELEKIILSGESAKGIELLVETGLMDFVMPELKQTIGVKQNRHHYNGPFNTVFAHMVASLDKCPSKKLEVRMAAFLHDIGKPETKEGEGEMATFHSHEYAGAHMVRKMLKRLKFSRKVIDKTVLLVKNHMFYYNVDEVGEAGVRRVVRRVGLENIEDLIDVRIADRLGSGVPKAVPYKLRHFKYMVEKVSKDPISVGQLKLKGDELMSELKMKPGPKVGTILEVLLARVIEEPKLNNKKDLLNIAKELEKQDLKKLCTMAKEKIEAERKKEEQETKKKHWIK